MPRAPRAKAGSYPERETTWASMEDFFEADERRLHSREVDYGVLWRPSGSRVIHRASWIEETGELYLVQSGPTGSGGGHVELLAVCDRDGVERPSRDGSRPPGDREDWPGCVSAWPASAGWARRRPAWAAPDVGRHPRLHPGLERGGLAARSARRGPPGPAGRGHARDRRRLRGRHRRGGRKGGALVVSPENRGLRSGIAEATGARPTAATSTAGASTPTASIPLPSSLACSRWCGRASATLPSARASCPSPDSTASATGRRPSAWWAPRCCACSCGCGSASRSRMAPAALRGQPQCPRAAGRSVRVRVTGGRGTGAHHRREAAPAGGARAHAPARARRVVVQGQAGGGAGGDDRAHAVCGRAAAPPSSGRQQGGWRRSCGAADQARAGRARRARPLSAQTGRCSGSLSGRSSRTSTRGLSSSRPRRRRPVKRGSSSASVTRVA